MSDVVITGLGLSTALGDTEQTWQAVRRNHITHASLEVSADSRVDAAQRLAKTVCEEALGQARLWKNDQIGIDPERIGCTLSVSKPLLGQSRSLPVAPETILQSVQTRFNLRGEARNVIAACATGPYAMALGAGWIEQKLCDVVVAGSVEAPLHPLMHAGFSQMGVLSDEGITRPFDCHRRGFVPAAGAGVVVLESIESARRRHVAPIVRLSGWGLGADGHSSVAFNSNGARIADVIARALARGSLSASEIGHVNAHGTGTRLNDWIETQALKKAFGSHASHLMISGTKATTGHLLGAAGSVEAVLTILAMRDQFIPSTASLETRDPDCSLDYTPRLGHAADFDCALSLSLGFGGPIGALIFARPS